MQREQFVIDLTSKNGKPEKILERVKYVRNQIKKIQHIQFGCLKNKREKCLKSWPCSELKIKMLFKK